MIGDSRKSSERLHWQRRCDVPRELLLRVGRQRDGLLQPTTTGVQRPMIHLTGRE
jgi:hypothetical protein